MDTVEIEGIVLGSIAYKETSKIVYLYTKMGRISVRALGSSRQKKGMLPLITTMNCVDVIATDKEFPSAIDYTLIDSYNAIKEDLKRNLWASYMLEITSKLTEDSPHDRIYELLKKSLELMKDRDPMLIGIMFEVKMTYGFGVAPSLRKCAICGSDSLAYLSIPDGGAICPNHSRANVYDKKSLDDFKKLYYFDIYNGNIDDLSDVDLMNVFKIINVYYENHIHIFLKGMNSLIF